jgi:hypothetical protein
MRIFNRFSRQSREARTQKAAQQKAYFDFEWTVFQGRCDNDVVPVLARISEGIDRSVALVGKGKTEEARQVLVTLLPLIEKVAETSDSNYFFMGDHARSMLGKRSKSSSLYGHPNPRVEITHKALDNICKQPIEGKPKPFLLSPMSHFQHDKFPVVLPELGNSVRDDDRDINRVARRYAKKEKKSRRFIGH